MKKRLTATLAGSLMLLASAAVPVAGAPVPAPEYADAWACYVDNQSDYTMYAGFRIDKGRLPDGVYVPTALSYVVVDAYPVVRGETYQGSRLVPFPLTDPTVRFNAQYYTNRPAVGGGFLQSQMTIIAEACERVPF